MFEFKYYTLNVFPIVNETSLHINCGINEKDMYKGLSTDLIIWMLTSLGIKKPIISCILLNFIQELVISVIPDFYLSLPTSFRL